MRYYLAALIALTLAVIPFPTPRSLIDAPTNASPAQRTTVLGYERDAFGPGWAPTREGCDTREALMAQAYAAGSCLAPYSTWQVAAITDPYTGKPLAPADVEIDHLYPLAAAWDLGAHSWPEETRLRFANDPMNLVVTSASANRAKSDQLPSEWLPPNPRAHCAYATQLVDVARAYSLPLPRADLRAARRACSGLTGLTGRPNL
ncbi:HNH endonuclease family protein [Corynebacterium sanguinis]|uniref:HNH endonuclease family protein n=1 Tax=Corynebacterium sanguinis TaxID=2594913 RepID=UPI00119FB519|nr:HNH endonuclease family protein [Corynebacterium sanguinis]MCT1694208.1 HNH endonuclease family protein [Corynebacterium sanguinis]MCT1713592.1 HNH endonuclease family protein [Corynebacterium sanguinis]TVS21256.1 HNH endonuclease [Corynebacterium sanguinis]